MTQLARPLAAAALVLATLPGVAACGTPSAASCDGLDTAAVQEPALQAVKAQLGAAREGKAAVSGYEVVGQRAEGARTSCFVKVSATADGRDGSGTAKHADGAWYTLADLVDGRTRVVETRTEPWPAEAMAQPADATRNLLVTFGAFLLGSFALLTLWALLRRRPVRLPEGANQPIATPRPRRAGPTRWVLWGLGLASGVAGLLAVPRTLVPGSDTFGTDTVVGVVVYLVGLAVMGLAWWQPASSRAR